MVVTATSPTINQDFKSVIIEDYDVDVGEAEVNTIVASDGTQYNFTGVQGDSLIEWTVLITDDTLQPMVESVYGAGTLVATTTTYDLISAGDVINQLVITAPTTSNNKQMVINGVNAKGLVFKPLFRIGNGWQGTVKYSVEKFQLAFDSDTTD